MSNITIYMKDGSVKDYPHEGRSGGSYTKTVRYEGGFAIIKDEYYNETAIPCADIKEVKISPNRY